jgi:hypothetical protein
MLSRTRSFALVVTTLLLSMMAVEATAADTNVARISNVVPRRDIDGNILDAHDGCLQKFGGRYYLYGTAYGKTDGFGKANRYRCYSSPDLMSWKLEGNLLKDPPPGVYYRPYVVYNAKTRKYVCWYNWYPTLWNGQFGVAVSDTPQGPFAIHDANVAVSQKSPGDLGLFIDADGTGYLIYTSIAKDHAISIEELTGDYLASTRKNSGVLGTGCEAPVLFKRQGTYYALFDNCCCFCSEGSGVRVYTASKPLGPYTAQKPLNINRDAKGMPLIHAQQTHVAQIPTPAGTACIWMGDRWQSTPDKVKGHDFQYWAPLEFTPDGGVVPLKQVDDWKIELPK